MYVSDDKKSGVIFNYLVNNRYAKRSEKPIKLKGLDPEKKYTIKEVNLYPGRGSRIDGSNEYSGDYLMKIGFNPGVNTRRTSVICTLAEVM